MGGRWVHVISDYTESSVLCANCGWVRRVDKAGRPKCSVAKTEQRGLNPHQRKRASTKECQLCGVLSERLETDHDHSCCDKNRGCPDCIRGVVCRQCNGKIARIEELSQTGELERILDWIS